MPRLHVSEIDRELPNICNYIYDQCGSVEGASKKLGVAKSTFWRWLKGKSRLSPEKFVAYFPEYDIYYGEQDPPIQIECYSFEELVKKLDLLGYELVIRRKIK